MYAVFSSGGKQYRVQEGDVVRLEKLPAEVGSSIDFNNILMIGDGDKIQMGRPFIDGGNISATIIAQGRGKKIEIVKFKRRKHHEKWQGHRQDYTEIKIDKIQA